MLETLCPDCNEYQRDCYCDDDDESDGMLSDETYDSLAADDWEEYGGDPRGEMRD